MLKYYVKLDKKYVRKKVFDTYIKAQEYYRELQRKYNTNALYIGVICK